MSLNFSYCNSNDCCYTYVANNKTWIPTGLPDTRYLDCQCSFDGDPDIAGPGVSLLCSPYNVASTEISKVMVAFIATAWITCIAAAINAYCGLSKKFDRYLSTHGTTDRTENFLNIVRTIVPFDIPESLATSRSLLALCRRYLAHCCYKAVTFVLDLFDEEMPRTAKIARSSLDLLCDIQVVTGTAIVIAGIVQKDSATFYHQQFVMNYWFLTLNSFWAARAGDLNENEDDDNWHYWTRLFAIFATVVPSTYYQWVTIQRQKRDWNSLYSGLCFITHDKSGFKQSYVWIAGLILFAVYLFFLLLAALTSRSPTWMDSLSKWTTDLENRCHKKYKDWTKSKLNKPISQGINLAALPAPQHTSLGSSNQQSVASCISTTERRFKKSKTLHYTAWVVLNFPLFIEWCFLQWLALMAWGDTQSIAIVLALFGFAGWNTYDLIDLKRSNAYLATNESAWGFGQVLPVVLLGLILLNILDVVQSECLDSIRETRY